MLSVFAGFGFAALCLAFAALELFTILDKQSGGAGAMISAEAPLLHSAAEVLPPLATAAFLFVAVALTYHHLMVMGRHVASVPVAGAGNGRRSISGLVMLVLCLSVGTLEFILFGGQAAGGGGAGHGHGAQLARALGLAALRALPAAATGTFFPAMALILVAHVRAGGEGGGTGAAAAADGPMPIQGLLHLLTKIAAGAAAALVGLMLMALTLSGAATY